MYKASAALQPCSGEMRSKRARQCHHSRYRTPGISTTCACYSPTSWTAAGRLLAAKGESNTSAIDIAAAGGKHHRHATRGPLRMQNTNCHSWSDRSPGKQTSPKCKLCLKLNKHTLVDAPVLFQLIPFKPHDNCITTASKPQPYSESWLNSNVTTHCACCNTARTVKLMSLSQKGTRAQQAVTKAAHAQ
jgi:hypothetical protein